MKEFVLLMTAILMTVSLNATAVDQSLAQKKKHKAT